MHLGKEQKKWITPATEGFSLESWDWATIAKLDGWQADLIISVTPHFYDEEPDANQMNKPRLDILLSMSDGTWVRYHPGANPIFSHEGTTQAMRIRYNRREKLLKQHK